MGFKNSGFPDFRFNPLGFRSSGILRRLARDCGLLSYATPEIDKVGKTSRTAVRGGALVGDGVTRLKLAELANLSLTYIDNTTKLEVVSAFNALGEFVIPTNGIAGLTVDYLGTTRTLDIAMRQSDGKIQLISELEPLIIQQEFSPVIPTVNSYQESLQDRLGVTFAKALGNQLFNKVLSETGDIDSVTGAEIPNPARTRSAFTLAEENTDYRLVDSTTVTGVRLACYDIDKVFLGIATFSNPKWITLASTYYVRAVFADLIVDDMMFNEGDSALPYEAWEGYYLDSLLTIPFEDGTPITNNNGYTIDGRISAEYPDTIKQNKDIINGIAYSGKNNDNWILSGDGTGTDGFNITIVQDPAGERAKLYDMVLEPDTDYVIVYDVTVNNSATMIILGAESDVDANTGMTETIGENRVVITTSSTISFNGLSLILSAGDIMFNSFEVYPVDSLADPGNPLTSALPTSGVYESGNSIILSQLYDGHNQYDTNEILWDSATDTNKVIPFDDMANITGLQLFVSEDKQKIYFYAEPLEGECLEKALKAIKALESVQVAEGQVLVSETEKVYVGKDWVTQ